MMSLLNQLPSSGQILTCGCMEEETEWPEGVIYNTQGPQGNITTTYNGQAVTEINMKPYGESEVHPQANIGLE